MNIVNFLRSVLSCERSALHELLCALRRMSFAALCALMVFFSLSAIAETELPPEPKIAAEIEQHLQARPRTRSFPFGTKRGVGGIVQDRPKVMATIHFDFDSDVIKAESYPLLREYGQALNGGLQNALLEIGGHTDSDGTDEYNLSLSQRRAQAVKAFLVGSFGIEDQRLRIRAYGESVPLRANDSEANKAINRRVEFARMGSLD